MSQSDSPSQRSWITSNLSWLSVCILAAAWGNRLLPGDWVYVWSFFGVFGLAAALGLAVVAKRRTNSKLDLVARSHCGA
jgi:hypothetical protein